MKRSLILAFLIATFLFGIRPADTRAQALTDAEFAAVMNDFIPRALEAVDGSVPGLSIAVVRGDKAVYTGGFGWADVDAQVHATADTDFYIASSTKSFTALATALLASEDIVDLDAPITDYAAGVEFDVSLDAQHVTFRHLLSHTHGLSNEPMAFRAAYTGEHTPDEMWALLAETKPNADAPLNTFEYDNVGFNILSVLLDRWTGERWQDLLDKHIFSPLGMNRTTAYASELEREHWPVATPYNGLAPSGGTEPVYLVKRDNMMQAAGGMYTTANDAARWLEVQLNDGLLDGEQVIPAAVVQETHRMFATTDAAYGPFKRNGYALGWYVGTYDNEPMLHHFGGFGGAHSHVSFMPDRDVGVAVFVNESGPGGQLAILVASLAYDLLHKGATALEQADEVLASFPGQLAQARERNAASLAERAVRKWQLTESFESYTGTYVSPRLGTLRVTIADGQPLVELGYMWAVATPFTTPETMRVELVPGRGQVVGFKRADDGSIAGAEFAGEFFERRE